MNLPGAQPRTVPRTVPHSPDPKLTAPFLSMMDQLGCLQRRRTGSRLNSLLLICLVPQIFSAPLLNFSDVPGILISENSSIWVASFGGVGTGHLVHFLELQGLKVNTTAWNKALCHFPHPIFAKVTRPFKAIYLYGDPLLAICSQKRRGYHIANLRKLRNNDETDYNDEHMLRAMAFQFEAWTEFYDHSFPVYRVSYRQMFDKCCQTKLSKFLNIDVVEYPGFHKRMSNQHCLANLTRSALGMGLSLRNRISEYRGNCHGCTNLRK